MSKRIFGILFLSSFLCRYLCFAQEVFQNDTLENISCGTNLPDSIDIIDFPEVQAGFPRGIDKMYEYFIQNLKYTTPKCVEGNVYVKFIITKDGSIINAHIIKGIDKNLNEEAIRVVSSMPKWIPASHNKKPVDSYFTLPINFQLN
jgi:TonB family protein